MANFFNGVNAMATPNVSVAVMSQKLGDAVPVISVDADSRLDVQRRRAAGEQELNSYSQALA
jgi:hypothetical protein